MSTFSEAKALITSELPAIPSRDLHRLVPEVVRQSARSFGEMTGRAVRNIVSAYIRHTYTDYDKVLAKAQTQRYGNAYADTKSLTQPAITEMLARWERAAI